MKQLTMQDMIVGYRYIVTTPSDDTTFLNGDIIKRTFDDCILCINESGWIPAENVEVATKGMLCELDIKHLQQQLKILYTTINEIKGVIHENCNSW